MIVKVYKELLYIEQLTKQKKVYIWYETFCLIKHISNLGYSFCVFFKEISWASFTQRNRRFVRVFVEPWTITLISVFLRKSL